MATAIYARKSVERENSISCETQIEYCMAMLRPDEKNGEILTFVDNGFSGGNTDRDGFRELMNRIKEGGIRKVICYRLDRISRSLSDFVGILDTLKKYDVRFVSSQESFDTSTPYGEMIVKILMVFAEFERQSIIERVTQTYAHRSDLGFYMGGRRPYGFTLVPTEIHGVKTKMLSPDHTEIGQIRYIFETYPAAGVSLRRLMNCLLKKSMIPPEGKWTTAKLSAIIKNPIYVRADNAIYEYYSDRKCSIVSNISSFDGIHGLQLYGKNKHSRDDMSDMKIVVMNHEGVVASDVWLSCQNKIEKNKHIGKSVSNQTSWLGGKIICGKCGKTMRAVKGSRRKDGSCIRYFGCTGKNNGTCTGPETTVYADSLEALMYDLIAHKLDVLKDVRINMNEGVSGSLNIMKNRACGIRADQEKLVDMILSGNAEPDMLKLLSARAEKLSEELEKINTKIKETQNSLQGRIIPVSLVQKWKTASFEEKRAVCLLMIDRISIKNDGSVEIIWSI